MDWLVRHLPRTKAEERREAEAAAVLRGMQAFMQELSDDVQAIKEAGADDRKGYPVEHALRRRPPHDRSA